MEEKLILDRFAQVTHFNQRLRTMIFHFNTAIAALVVLNASAFAQSSGTQKPNIVFIMADDLGWRDLGCYGSTFHQTPNLDKLAARGTRFTQAYAANPLCSPTRSSILTGLWPARTGITAPACHLPQIVLEKQLAKGNPNNRVLSATSVTRLKTDYVTLPKVLRDAGYRTGHFGKWHLGAEPYSPLQHGFDVDWPHWPGPGPAGSYVAPWKYPAALKVESQPGEHIEDTLSSQVVKFIRENKDRPFYANYWTFSVHSPYDAKDELVAKYRKLTDPKNPQRNPVYAAMVESLDDGIGRVLSALDECGIADKTIVVFCSDNGGVSWAGRDGDANHKIARFQTDMTSPPTSNLPLRNGKASLYEGGVREPCLVVWPGVTKPSTVNDTVIQSIDWMPTLLDMAGVPLPSNTKLDGLSIASVLKGGTLNREAIFTHFPHDTPASGQHPGTSVRRGDWKLIRLFAGNADGSDTLELFNLKDDLGETRDLAAEKPEIAKELNALITGFLKETDAVIPKRNPAYKTASQATTKNESGEWTTSKDARLVLAENELRIESLGGDPWFFTRDVPAARGPLTLEWSMKSTAKGDGQVFFTTSPKLGFGRGQSVPVAVTHDGTFHDYKVAFGDAERIHALRIDPATAPGNIVIRNLVLRDAEGTVAKAWAFAPMAVSKTTKTSVSIVGEDFHINGQPTYVGRTWKGRRVEGLLLNSRMVQATYDDRNPETAQRWAYADTGKWDAERNVREFIAAMPEWKAHGLLAVTLNFQGGSPEGYSGKQTWLTGAFDNDGALRPEFADRMRRVLDAADAQGMVVILGYFYFGQDQHLRDEAAVIRATDTATRWLLDGGWRNVIVEVNNETNIKAYDHEILRPAVYMS